MTAGPTLHSRLRVLVAKAFRAEKLYTSATSSSPSLRNASLAQSSMTHSGMSSGTARRSASTRVDRGTNMAILGEAAGDIRAKEWQRSYYQLRTALNEILSLGNQGVIIGEILKLRDAFLLRSEDSAAMVEKGSEELIETAKRHEFAHIFKISLELIRLKAQAQSNRVIAEELSALLDASGVHPDRKTAPADSIPVVIRHLDHLVLDHHVLDHHLDASDSRANIEGDSSQDTESEEAAPSNVIEFRHRAGQRARRR